MFLLVSLQTFLRSVFTIFLRTIIRAFYGRLFSLFTDDYSRFLRTIIRAFYGRSYYFFTCKKHRLYIKNTRSLCLERVYTTLSFKTRVI
jgi:hypothetical protein